MRAVAERVGLTSMALYPYVDGRDALLDGLVELLADELRTAVADAPQDEDWRHRLRALGRAVRAVSRAHPRAYPLMLNRPGASASWLDAAVRGALHDAGVPDAALPRLGRLWAGFLLGLTTAGVTGALAAPDDAEFEADLADLLELTAAKAELPV
jgi:AcrR family transcriptional regulator